MFFYEPSGFGCLVALIFSIWFIRRNNKRKRIVEIGNKFLNGEKVDLSQYKNITKKDLDKAFGKYVKIIEINDKFYKTHKSTKQNLAEYKKALINKALKTRKFGV